MIDIHALRALSVVAMEKQDPKRWPWVVPDVSANGRHEIQMSLADCELVVALRNGCAELLNLAERGAVAKDARWDALREQLAAIVEEMKLCR